MPNWKKLVISGSDASLKSITVTNGVTGSLLGTSATASFTPNALVTASVSLNTLTFTKGNGSTFNLTVDTGSGGGATPGGNQYHVQVNNGSNGFIGDQYFQYNYQSQKIAISTGADPIATPLTNNNDYATERFNSYNTIQVDNTTYQFTNAQFPYSKYLTNGGITAILDIDTNAGSGTGPGLLSHAFKCDYTLVSLNALDKMVRGTRTGTLYCVWDEDKASYNPVITDTTLTSTSGVTLDKLDDAVFTVAWNSSNIELSLDTTLCNGNIIFNGIFTIFSMR